MINILLHSQMSNEFCIDSYKVFDLAEIIFSSFPWPCIGCDIRDAIYDILKTIYPSWQSYTKSVRSSWLINQNCFSWHNLIWVTLYPYLTIWFRLNSTKIRWDSFILAKVLSLLLTSYSWALIDQLVIF